MSFDTIVNLVITVNSRAPEQASFGTPLLLGYTAAWLDELVREFADPSELLDAGMTTDDTLYKAGVILKSQEVSPPTFKVGRRTTPLTQITHLTPTVVTPGYVYKPVVLGTEVSYEVQTGNTVEDIVTALQPTIHALAGVTCTEDNTKLVVTGDTPGVNFSVDPGKGMLVSDATADTTTDDALAAILDEDDDFYALTVVDSLSKATGLLGAAFTESVRKIGLFQSGDSACWDGSSTTDLMYAAQALDYSRSGICFHKPLHGSEYLAVGMLAGRLPHDPGAETWAFKSVAGVTVDALSASQQNAILAKNGSHYTRTGGRNFYFEGKAASGMFQDTIRGIDWVYARIRERVIYVLTNNLVVPYTDSGVDLMVSNIQSVLDQAVVMGIFAANPAPVVTAPLVANVAIELRAARILPDIKFTARLAGAIHRLNPVTGLVSV